MSVKKLSGNQQRLECDGRHQVGRCTNHYVFDSTPAAMQAAEEWLQSHGWRTKVDDGIAFFYCPQCANRMPEFYDTRKPHTEMGKGSTGYRISR